MSLWCQMALGLVFSALAMIVAGVVEIYRMEHYWGIDNPSPTKPCCRREQVIGEYLSAFLTFLALIMFFSFYKDSPQAQLVPCKLQGVTEKFL